ncbi:MAG TPA: polymer-forming cytoskeletal protein [Candidatus Dormibacteraeota bacterium]|nr:polymer-forming cytoskeletal protein [Candidatus Dormibacteraeota bacterium]
MNALRRQLKVALVAIVGVLFVAGFTPVTALAADSRQGNSITIGPNEVINDDLYVAASTIDIQGTINGNLFAAGTSITVSGTVTRDVNAAGTNISIPGEVQGSARLAGSSVIVSGKVDGDLMAMATTLTVQSQASVARDVIAAASTATFAGPIGRNVKVGGTDITFSAPVGGDVTVSASTLKLAEGAVIQGNLDYTSNQGVDNAGGTVAGSTHHYYPSNGPTFASRVIGWFQTLFGFLLLGFLVILIAPRFNEKAVTAYKTAPWSRFGVGLAILVVVPFVALFTFVAGLIVGGWWLSLFLLAAYAFVTLVGFAIVGEMIGRFTLERFGQPAVHPLVALLVGMPALLIVTIIPVIGWLVGVIAVIYGVGVVAFALPWSAPTTPQAAAPALPTAALTRPSPSAG